MALVKKLVSSCIIYCVMAPAFANDCINHFESHTTQEVMLFQGCELKDEDLPSIVNYANDHPDIETLVLDNNQLTDKGVNELSNLSSHVKAIYICGNQIQGSSLFILRNLELDTHLIYDNPLDSAGLKGLLSNKHIRNIWVSSDRLNDDFVSAVIHRDFDMLGIESQIVSSAAWQAIAESTQTKLLLLAGNKDTINDQVANKISTNKSVEVLYLKDNTISTSGFTQIFNNSHIQTFETNQLDENSAFLELLGNSLYLKRLFVNPDHDVILNMAIGKHIARNQSLEGMLLISDKDHECVLDADFAEALSQTHITELTINHYKLDDAAAMRLAQSPYLKTLEIEGGQIGNAGAIALANNRSLVTLDLSSNNIADQGALAFIQNETLESLELLSNPISEAAGQALISQSKIKNIRIK